MSASPAAVPGNGMVYLAGKQSHRMSNEQMIDHIVEQVERKAAEIEARDAARSRGGGVRRSGLRGAGRT
jgi:hypothetical protein